MSQFFTSSGKKIPHMSYGAIRLVPAEKAQEYVSRLIPVLEEEDGEFVYFVDDGTSGTSDEIFTEVDEAINKRGTIDGTVFADMLVDLYSVGHTIRIWYAHSGVDDYKEVVECGDLNELKQVLSSQGAIYRVRLAANKAFSRTRNRAG
jgi:hypothetical protein